MAPPSTPLTDAGSSTGNTIDPTKYTSPPTDSDGESPRDLDDPRIGPADDETEEDDDEDEEDMDFLPARERGEEDEDEYESASEGLSGIDIEFEVLEEGSEVMDEDSEDEEEDGEGEETETETGTLGDILGRAGGGARPVFVTREQIARMLGTAGLRRLLARGGGGGIASLLGADDSEEEDEDDDDFGFDPRTRTRSSRRTRPPVEFEKVPSEEGRKLMLSGTFGGNERGEDSFKRRKKLASRLLRREMGLGSRGRQKVRDGLLRQDLIPSSKADTIIHYPARCYSGQFSTDGNFFFSCGQDFKVRMYDTSNPYKWKYYKVVDNPHGQWTITDASLSADNKWLAYSSISRLVCLASTDPSDSSQPQILDFSRLRSGTAGAPHWAHRAHSHFGIWSIRFSGDGKEIVAGTGDHSVYVFDIERNESILRIQGHEDDVNAVCFGDAASPHILYSGSDDTTLKVWDRRSLGDGRAAGTFLGHTEGLTYVDSKGDGRYIISNGKDQTAKLWDLRKVISTEDADKINIHRYTNGFEYRMNSYNFNQWRKHPYDCSLVTFRGHSVLKTLIRCHFSPLGSTDSRYVYSGSYDGKVYIWNLDATLKGTIDVAEATRHLRNGAGNEEYDDGHWGYGGHGGFSTCVRDASWHPDVPVIAATSWNGYGSSLGTCTVHSWSDGADSDDEGSPAKEQRVDARLVPERVREPRDDEDEGWFGRRTRRRGGGGLLG